MISSAAPTSEFFELMCMLSEGQISAEQADRLEELLWADPANQAYYVDFMLLVTGLHRTRGSSGTQARSPAIDHGGTVEDESCRNQPSVPSSYIPTFLSATIPSTFSYFSSGWPLAYLLATVIFGIGLFIGSIIHVSQPEQVAQRSAFPSAFGRGTGGEGSENAAHSRPTVGRITGMVDCQWVQSPTLDSRLSTLVSLGDKFTLASGLMEITYDTGARVILQGPVTYEVESKDGGYLSLGKLTARVEKRVGSGQWAVDSKSEIRNQKSEIPDPQSPIPNPSSLSTIHYPLFTIKTPTAIVTDLGTEFGVEVDKQGRTTSHVFRGVVRVQMVAVDGKAQGTGQVLHENESVRVDASQGQRKIVMVPAAKTASFIREIPKRTIKTLDLVDVVAGGDGFPAKRVIAASIPPPAGSSMH